jgi:hypothetical protein
MDDEFEKKIHKNLKYDTYNKLKLQHILIGIQHILIEITTHNMVPTMCNKMM